jgi:hypothetical protein
VAPYNFSSIAIGSSYLAFGIGSILGKSVSFFLFFFFWRQAAFPR